MRNSKWIASTLTLLSLMSYIEANQHKEIVAIGNSDTDSGNTPFDFYYPLVNFPPGIVYPGFPSFSNGAKWVVRLGDLWGIEVEPSRRGGLNFACAEAQTGVDTSFGPLNTLADVRVPGGGADIPLGSINPLISTFFVPSMRTQTNEFLTQKKYVSKKATIFHQGSFNNLIVSLLTPFPDPAGAANTAVSDTIANLQALKNAGYRNQVTFNLHLGLALSPPVAPGATPAALQLFTNTFNTNILSALKEASLNPVVIDLQNFDLDLLSNLAFYGFTGGLGPMTTLTGPNDTFFWFDGLHRSEQHEFLLSQYVYNILEAPASWGQFAVQPFALMRGLNAVLRQELYPISDLCDCRLYTFVAGGYAPEQKAPYVNGKIRDTSGWNGTLGLAYKFCSFWTLGLAGSYNHNSFEHRNKLGKSEADLRSWMISLLSGMEFCHGYLNGIFNAGFMKFDDIHRSFSIGPKQWRATGDTNGMQYDGLLEGGWFFYDCNNFKFGPFVTIEYQRSHVDGYKEHGASYNNLQYKNQHANSFVTGIGLEGLWWLPCDDNCCEETCCKEDCPPGYSINMFLAANEEWVHNTRHVRFRQIVLDNAPDGKWPIYQKRTLFGSGGINLTKTFNNGTIFSLGYRGDWGEHHMGDHNIVANLTFPLWCCD